MLRKLNEAFSPDDQKGKSYQASPKQEDIIKKMPKKNGGSNNEDTSFNHGANVKSEPTKQRSEPVNMCASDDKNHGHQLSLTF